MVGAPAVNSASTQTGAPIEPAARGQMRAAKTVYRQ
jgi:hypothetical protein